jgi:ElaB/YqjD/DUF883 family membrane-anchored ribosome-binding protein
MARQQALDNLKLKDSMFVSIEKAKLFRKNLGDESLEKELEPIMGSLDQIRHFVMQYAPYVHDSKVDSISLALEYIAARLTSLSKMTNQEYMAKKAAMLGEIANQMEEMNQWLPYFVTAAIQTRGFLEDEGIRKEYEKTIYEMKSVADSTLAAVKAEADKAVQEAKALADRIEERAHRTASKISVKEAQDQFGAAKTDLGKKTIWWGIGTGASVLILIGVAIAFLYWPLPLEHENSNKVLWPTPVYHAILRIFIISAIAYVASSSFRIFKAHLHMASLNDHRIRVSNSIESFVNSTVSPDQRDLILAKLVEAVVNFGDSGLLKVEKDDSPSPSLSGDFVGRVLSALSKK